MWKHAIGYAVLLIALGISFYAITDPHAKTALIPAAFGIPVLVCGVLSIGEKYRMHAMHVAATIGLLLFFMGAVMGLPKIPALINGTTDRPGAVIEQSIMAVLSLVFVVLCVKSFIDVRRARKKKEQEAQNA